MLSPSSYRYSCSHFVEVNDDFTVVVAIEFGVPILVGVLASS